MKKIYVRYQNQKYDQFFVVSDTGVHTSTLSIKGVLEYLKFSDNEKIILDLDVLQDYKELNQKLSLTYERIAQKEQEINRVQKHWNEVFNDLYNLYLDV